MRKYLLRDLAWDFLYVFNIKLFITLNYSLTTSLLILSIFAPALAFCQQEEAHVYADSIYGYEDVDRKTRYVTFGYRQSIDSRNYLGYVPEAQFVLGTFYTSIRYNTLIAYGPRENDQVQSLDIQFLGFRTPPDQRVVFNLSMGVLIDLNESKAHSEFVTGLRFNLANQLSFHGEARLSANEGLFGRSERSLGISYPIFLHEKYTIRAHGFFTSSTYVMKLRRLRTDVFGLGATITL